MCGHKGGGTVRQPKNLQPAVKLSDPGLGLVKMLEILHTRPLPAFYGVKTQLFSSLTGSRERAALRWPKKAKKVELDHLPR